MNDRHRLLARPSFPQYAYSLTGRLHTNGYKLKSLLLETAAALSFASLPAFFEKAKVYTKAMMPYVNATKPEKAISPHIPRTFTLNGVSYGAAGGFPSGKLPELGYAIWERIRLDNAKANLSNETITALCEFIGCTVDAGPPHQPDDRPYIERFFGTIASTLSSRMPGYTGSSPTDVRRALGDVKGNIRLFVSLSDMEELMEASIASYNATPHAGLNGKSPLEAMTYFIRAKSQLLLWLPEPKRKTMCLMQTPHRCRVRGYLPQGTRGHITLFQVRYTNQVLAASGTLLGKDCR